MMLKEIAEHRGIKLIEIQSGDEYCKANGEEAYIDHSFICGKAIELGIYDDPEKKILSFFHEVGHTMLSSRFCKKAKNVFEIEQMAWRKGYKLAKFYGIEFNKDTKEWAKEQLETYRGFEENEAKSCQEIGANPVITSFKI